MIVRTARKGRSHSHRAKVGNGREAPRKARRKPAKAGGDRTWAAISAERKKETVKRTQDD